MRPFRFTELSSRSHVLAHGLIVRAVHPALRLVVLNKVDREAVTAARCAEVAPTSRTSHEQRRRAVPRQRMPSVHRSKTSCLTCSRAMALRISSSTSQHCTHPIEPQCGCRLCTGVSLSPDEIDSGQGKGRREGGRAGGRGRGVFGGVQELRLAGMPLRVKDGRRRRSKRCSFCSRRIGAIIPPNISALTSKRRSFRCPYRISARLVLVGIRAGRPLSICSPSRSWIPRNRSVCLCAHVHAPACIHLVSFTCI
jgi:hypothetical protein